VVTVRISCHSNQLKLLIGYPSLMLKYRFIDVSNRIGSMPQNRFLDILSIFVGLMARNRKTTLLYTAKNTLNFAND